MSLITKQAGWRIDVNQCISCRACEMACKVEYGLQAGQGRRRRVIERTLVDAGGVPRTYFVSVSCHHCAAPACKQACPRSMDMVDGAAAAGDSPLASALYKDLTGAYAGTEATGVVLHNPANCVGCRRCEWACPYGAPQFNFVTNKIHKCELCWQRQQNTALAVERRRPACEATCLGGSIIYAPGNAGTTADPVTTASTGWANFGASHGASYTGTPNDYAIDPTAVSGTEWARAGENPTATGYSVGRGSSESALYNMTYPAIRFRTRVYLSRNGAAGGVQNI